MVVCNFVTSLKVDKNEMNENNDSADDVEMNSENESDNDRNDDAGSIHSDTTYNDQDDGDEDDSDDDDDEDPEESLTGEKTAEKPASGMADIMAKLLRKAIPEGKNPILCKATSERALVERKRKRKGKESAKEFEVVEVKKEEGMEETPADLRVSENEDNEDDDDDKDKIKKLKMETYREQLNKKKAWEEIGRVRPRPLDRELERSLQRIATKGVVQLFNAVRKQQALNDEKSKSAAPLSAIEKCGNFLDALKQKGEKKEEKQEADESTWSILRDDFMMGSTSMKDWDTVDS